MDWVKNILDVMKKAIRDFEGRSDFPFYNRRRYILKKRTRVWEIPGNFWNFQKIDLSTSSPSLFGNKFYFVFINKYYFGQQMDHVILAWWRVLITLSCFARVSLGWWGLNSCIVRNIYWIIAVSILAYASTTWCHSASGSNVLTSLFSGKKIISVVDHWSMHLMTSFRCYLEVLRPIWAW